MSLSLVGQNLQQVVLQYGETVHLSTLLDFFQIVDHFNFTSSNGTDPNSCANAVLGTQSVKAQIQS